MSIFSKRLIKRRELKDWTKTKVAQKLHVSPQRYSNWEYGKREPDYGILKKIAELFDTSTDYLLGKTDDPSSTNKNNSTKNVDLKDDPVVISYGGKPVSKDDMEIIKAILRRHKDNE